jgi:hypothetical protein
MKTTPNETVAKFKISGDWSKQADELRDDYPTLTFQDLKFSRGKEDDLIHRIELRLHKKREFVISMLKKVQTAT